MEGFPIIKSSTDTRQHTGDGKYGNSTGLNCLLFVIESMMKMAYVCSISSKKSSEGSVQADEGCKDG